jgi:SAM-dependent methyltransferase
MRLNDPAHVGREYAEESRLAARELVHVDATGPSPRQVVFEAVAEGRPRRVLEVGSGRGELAKRIQRELRAEVVAIDQSQRMVELTRAGGVEAIVGDVQDLPFPNGSFDAVLAAWMLYHVPDLSRALREIRRVLHPSGRLVAATNSERTLSELWELVGYVPKYTFSAENAEWQLLRQFTVVERRDVRGTLTFPDREAAREYVAASINARHLADRLPHFDGPLHTSRRVVVFVCEP